jgi:hypothetical protein
MSLMVVILYSLFLITTVGKIREAYHHHRTTLYKLRLWGGLIFNIIIYVLIFKYLP